MWGFLNTTIINSYTIYHSFFTLFTDSLDVIFNMVQLFTFEMFRLMLYFLPVYLLGFIMVLIFLEIVLSELKKKFFATCCVIVEAP